MVRFRGSRFLIRSWLGMANKCRLWRQISPFKKSRQKWHRNLIYRMRGSNIGLGYPSTIGITTFRATAMGRPLSVPRWKYRLRGWTGPNTIICDKVAAICNGTEWCPWQQLGLVKFCFAEPDFRPHLLLPGTDGFDVFRGTCEQRKLLTLSGS